MFIKDITYTTRSALYFDLNIDIDSDRRIRTKIYEEKLINSELSIFV
jgi:hypothetical protein